MSEQLWWYVARASGLVAWGLVSASVLWGLFVSTRVLGKRPSPAWFLDLHRWLGALSVIFTGVHVVGLVADSYVHFGVAELLVPFASSWRPAAVGWGVVAFYLLVAIQITSLLMRKLPRKVWSWVHRSSFALFIVATVHGLTAGTDTGGTAMRVAALTVSAAVLFLWLVRHLAPRGAAKRREHAAGQTRPQARAPRPAGDHGASAPDISRISSEPVTTPSP